MRNITLMSGVIAVALAGCVSVLPEPQTPDALYRIEAVSSPVKLTKTVTIREPEAPQIMSGRAMTREDVSGAIRLIPSVEWAGRSTRLMQLALVDSFVGETGGAVLPETGIQAELELSTRLSTLGFVDDTAVCKGTVSLLDMKTRTILQQARIEARAQKGGNASASTLKDASEMCVAEITEFVKDTLGENAE